MSGANGPQTQATGFNFPHSQLDSQPNYNFSDLTQDGNGYADFQDFSGLTQVSGCRHKADLARNSETAVQETTF